MATKYCRKNRRNVDLIFDCALCPAFDKKYKNSCRYDGWRSKKIKKGGIDMKIKGAVLREFLSTVLTNGSTIVGEVVLDFTDKGLKVTAQVSAQTVYIEGLLNKKAFTDYETIGKLGIRDLGQLINYLRGIDGEITLTKNEDTLTIKSKIRKVTAKLVDIEYMEKVPEGVLSKLEPLVADNKFELDIGRLQNFFGYVTAVGSSTLRIASKKDAIYLQTKSEDTVVDKIETNVSKDFDLTLGVNFIDAISNLKGIVIIGANTDKPILVTNETDLSKVTIAVIPMVREK